jgi:hypothetical protein
VKGDHHSVQDAKMQQLKIEDPNDGTHLQELKIGNPNGSTYPQALKIDIGLIIGLAILFIILLVIVVAWMMDNDIRFLENIRPLHFVPLRF